jgi:two-component system, LytTR family, response regulator
MVKEKIRSVIVEDEPSARMALKAYLEKYCPQINVVAEASNANEADKILHDLKPQLVFLDVELPFGNAFDILERCSDLQFETIFVTAFSEYSLRALNQSAAYYLLKPVNIEELITAVDRAAEEIAKTEYFDRNKYVVQNFREQKSERRQIILPTVEGFEVVKLEDVIRLQGNGNFTDIFLKDGTKKMACRFLKHYDEILSHPFIRVHRSHIVNMDCVKSYQRSGSVIMTDNSEVDVSTAYKEEFLSHFK